MPNNTDDHTDNEEFITKSQIKREAEALKQLGREIYELPKKKRDKLPLSNTLLTALEEADRISNLNAMRRHFQYVGKILRETDVDAIKSAMEALEISPLSHQRNDARLEDLIEKLLTVGSKANEKLIQEHAQLNRQQLNQLIRNVLRSEKTIEEDKASDPHTAHPTSPARKKLKRYLKENLDVL